MPANTLAVFAPKAPVEPTAPTQERANDNGSDFKDFMESASNKVDTAQKSSKENLSDYQKDSRTDNVPSNKTETKDPSHTEDSRFPSSSETLTPDSSIEDATALTTQLQELGISQAQYESMLKLFGLNEDADLDSLLQSMVQGLNLNQNSLGDGTGQSDLLTKIQQNMGEATNLLKQAGLSDAQAKTFLDNLQSLKDINLQAKINSQINQSDKEGVELSTAESSQNKKGEKPDFLTQFKEPAKEITNRPAKGAAKSELADKLSETPKPNETPRVTTQEPVKESGNKNANLGELLNDKNSQANIVQTESFADAKGLKGMETAKTAPDLQIQPPSVTVNTAVKALESSKPILPENLLARGATEAKIINQIANTMTIRTNGTQNEVHINLDPPSLGKVRMNITTSGDTVRATIVAENHAVKQVIETNFNQLRDAMADQGLKLDSFTVTVGGESENQNPSGESFNEENNASLLDQTASDEAEQESTNEPVSLFFADNQSISVIA
jgi:flagellar hook-length control protein FliK